jgi:hypothetical protein
MRWAIGSAAASFRALLERIVVDDVDDKKRHPRALMRAPQRGVMCARSPERPPQRWPTNLAHPIVPSAIRSALSRVVFRADRAAAACRPIASRIASPHFIIAKAPDITPIKNIPIVASSG